MRWTVGKVQALVRRDALAPDDFDSPLACSSRAFGNEAECGVTSLVLAATGATLGRTFLYHAAIVMGYWVSKIMAVSIVTSRLMAAKEILRLDDDRPRSWICTRPKTIVFLLDRIHLLA